MHALLQVDVNYQDGLELIKMLSVSLRNKKDAQKYMLNRPTMPTNSNTSPTTVGESIV